MSDDLRDKFVLQEIIEYQELLYNSFIIEQKKFIQIPEKFTKNANMPMYVFYCETLPDTDTFTLILN